MTELILIGITLFVSGITIMEYMEYYFEGTHDNFIDYLKDKYKK